MALLNGRSAVVTGATRGIGLAIAHALLERDTRVLICARNESKVREVVGSLNERHPGRVWGSACDVRDFEQVHVMFVEAVRAMGGVDILVNNAGVGSHSYVESMSPDEWKRTIETNLSGVFFCCHDAIPLMRSAGGGYIINIGSLAGRHASPGGAAYCATKFGLIGFSESLMEEIRHDHIRVSCVMPGSVNTGFGRSAAQDPASSWKLAPEDVAGVVINLLEMEPRALPSRVEMRPSEPKK